MHYSANCKAQYWDCMSSVRLTVTLLDQDYISWKSWQLIAWTIIPTPSLFILRSPKAIHLLPGEHVESLWRIEVRWGKVGCWSTKAAISLKRVKIDEKLLRSTYRNSPMLFRRVLSPNTYFLPFPKIGGLQPQPETAIAIISWTGKATDCKFRRYIHRVHLNKSPLKIWEKRETH